MNHEESSKSCIPFVQEAIERATKDKITSITSCNSKRHYIFVTEKGTSYQMMFKSEFFNSFGKIFHKVGIGESVNKDWVEFALRGKVDYFLFVHSHTIYICPVFDFYDYATTNKTIRTTSDGEITMSVPITMLKRL